ncbi:hypothetical protein OEZ85_003864 [Tetradesmus obliquus]|uniref:CDP-diacylglycerol--glycerol-3-phosphate 3-phosphatidyltransferase n=1 Tax=Tetradesmus obliquus TaxID=3088 RepID=A0ABY8UCN4_TETOB|nr:hypothetical protein OEZ85_003864 [Tetradesmus obliquus]
MLPSAAAAAAAAGGAGSTLVQQQQQQVPGASWTSLPNLLSLSRVVSGPVAAHLVLTQQWPLAFALTAAAGVTDWADGYLARRLGHTSKLGSYLDPLADKVLIASVVGSMGWNGMLPAWLAVLVVGRDSAQVVGMFVYRLRMFGGRWPGAAAFFDVDAAVPQQQQQQQQQQQDVVTSQEDVAAKPPSSTISSSSSSVDDATGPAAAAAAADWRPPPGVIASWCKKQAKPRRQT